MPPQTASASDARLSYACWLATYPIAGVLGSVLSLAATASILGGVAAAAVLVAGLAWRADAVASVKPTQVAAHRA